MTSSDLLLEIARCPNAQTCLRDGGPDHPCSEIVGSQASLSGSFQLPEPWSGHIECAPILFLSSNPSIGDLPRDSFPRFSWSDQSIAEYFTYRFDGRAGQKPWIADGKRSLKPTGTYGGVVRYWASVKRRARELLPGHDIRPGIDYALTEVVHCKSQKEFGVPRARDECADRYLRRVVAVSGASVIVCMGKHARTAVGREFRIPVRRNFSIPEGHAVSKPVLIGQEERYFTFLPAATAFGPQKFENCLTVDQLDFLRDVLVGRESAHMSCQHQNGQ